MRTFVWFFLVVFILEVFGKAIILANKDFERKPMHIAIDILLNTLFATWAAWLLAV